MPIRTVSAHEWSQIFAKAWSNESFAELLRADPTAAVRQFLNVHHDTALHIFMVPPRPADLTDDQIDGVIKGIHHIAMPYCC
jgi:hypothetical protein